MVQKEVPMQFKVFQSSDTNVKKYVFEWSKDESPTFKPTKAAIAEAVLYRYGSYSERTVICCSVMSGCPVGCTFCGTGKFFVRNLTADEIVQQVDTAISDSVLKDTCTECIKKFQIMFMSMGEPLMNYYNLECAIKRLHEKYPNAALLVSTSAPTAGMPFITELIKLSQQIDKIGLQFSVHESTDENRAKLIPTKTCTLRQIASMGNMWAAFVGRKPFYNYCVHEGNNTAEDAQRLVELFDPKVWETTLSVICSKDESVAASIDRQLGVIDKFKTELLNRGVSLRVFNPAGQDDIGGGCGQLWYFQEWLKSNNK